MDKKISFLINLKLFEFRREYKADLSSQQIRKILDNTVWSKGVPARLNQIAKDIRELTYGTVTDYLAEDDSSLEYDFSNMEGEIK